MQCAALVDRSHHGLKLLLLDRNLHLGCNSVEILHLVLSPTSEQRWDLFEINFESLLQTGTVSNRLELASAVVRSRTLIDGSATQLS